MIPWEQAVNSRRLGAPAAASSSCGTGSRPVPFRVTLLVARLLSVLIPLAPFVDVSDSSTMAVG